MRIVAAILAAGSGSRFGGDKVHRELNGQPLWRHALEAFLNHPRVDAVGLVVALDHVDSTRRQSPEAAFIIPGGASRQASAFAALQAAEPADYLLVHDGARPFVSGEVIDRVIEAMLRIGAAGAAIPVSDTIRQVATGQATILDRSQLRAMQTPQGARTDWLREAHASAAGEFTDDLAMLEAIGKPFELVLGDPENRKITYSIDMPSETESRTGIGYDIHAFSDDPERKLWLGGIEFPGEQALSGHSDADVVLHAAVDAILGAISAGDIGEHFPNNEPRWRGEPSSTFLAKAAEILQEQGWRMVNMDITVIAERPKVMPQAPRIKSRIAEVLKVDSDRISVKATTNENLGALGRAEGIACFAVATVSRKI